MSRPIHSPAPTIRIARLVRPRVEFTNPSLIVRTSPTTAPSERIHHKTFMMQTEYPTGAVSAIFIDDRCKFGKAERSKERYECAIYLIAPKQSDCEQGCKDRAQAEVFNKGFHSSRVQHDGPKHARQGVKIGAVREAEPRAARSGATHG
jgi:hypothetical protein